jgi:ribosomal protein S18 acetylase RimI-like enzyme
MEMNIRKVNSVDSDCIAGLFDRYRVFYRQSPDLDLARKYIKARLDNHESIIFAAWVEEDDNIIPVGFTQLYPNYSSIHAIRNWTLNDLYVEPAYRCRKIGAALIRAAMDFARQGGARFLELQTAVDNSIAKDLYERIGFIKQPPDTEFFTYRLLLTIQNLQS